MPTKTELEAEVAVLRAKLAASPPENYMQRVNPNLIVVLHYTSKALWLFLAATFGLIGFQLYAIGVKAVGNAEATLPLGISVSLKDAGPGLTVMVVALLCCLVGAVKAKVVLEPHIITFTAPIHDNDSKKIEEIPDVHDTVTIQGIENLKWVWGLIEVAQLYRIPVAELVSKEEAAEIARLQGRKPLQDEWGQKLCSIVRASAHFEGWLRALPTRELPEFGDKKVRIDSSLPWCVRLRWGAGIGDRVDIFVCATAEQTISRF